jgi:hypothetical protein
MVLDFALPQVGEPGFGADLNTALVASKGQLPPDGSSPQLVWADPATQTLMMKPLQLDSSWLNSEKALPSILRLGSDILVNPADTSAGYISERPAFGNIANPWVYHLGTTPSDYFPGAHRPVSPYPPASADAGDRRPSEFPTSPPLLTGVSPGYDPAVNDALTIRANAGYAQPTIVPPPPPAAPPTPVQTIFTSTGRFLAQTNGFAPNQALFLRWYQVQSDLGFPPVYSFYIGQFRLDIKDVIVQVSQDISAHGDRSAYKHVATLPLFSVNDFSVRRGSLDYNWQSFTGNFDALFSHDRWLLWLPFRRNQVLLLSNTGKYGLVQTRPLPKRLPDNSDWDIVRADKLAVWVLTPHWGRFQIQKVAYSTTLATCNFPPITLEYAPATPPTQTAFLDTDHGTAIAITQTTPVAYNLPVNNTNTCPPIPAGIPSVQSRQYGYQAVFAASPAGDWTPFFYNLRITKNATFVTPPTTPHTVNDVTANPPSGSSILSCEFSAGLNPGEGKATIHVADFSPYDLNNYYYRSGNPVQIQVATVPAFTGYTLPPGVEPLKMQTTHPRRIIFTAADRWWQLTKTWLRDTQDYTGTGHMDVVQRIMQQGGIDTTGMDTPPKTAQYNQVLGLIGTADAPADTVAGRTNSPWQPRPGETCASFIQRIARNFSTWVIGFQADGTPFYHPRYYYTTSELTLYENQSAATAAGEMDPRFYRRIVFSTIEPEANAILVKANSTEPGGGPQYSSLYVDWASIRNKNVVNYLGRYKLEVVEIFGSYSCQGLNWAARQIFEQTRRRHVIARFDCDYDPKIKVGHVLTLHGTPNNYGDYRVLSFKAVFSGQTRHIVTVEAEFVEAGSGPVTLTNTPNGQPT